MKFNFFSIAYVGYCKTTKKKIIFIYYFSILFSLYLVVPVPGTLLPVPYNLTLGIPVRPRRIHQDDN